jgi:hypothetical protein
MTISLNQQIEEVLRELELRRRVYPHQVARRAMRQSVADFHMQRMEAVLDTLEALRRQQEEKTCA